MLIAAVIDWLKRNGLRHLVVPVVLYSLALIFITWPLVLNLSTHVAGPETTDSIEYVRLGWWARYALTHGLNPFYQSLFGYPDGLFSATQWSQPLIYWPITLLGFLVDPVAAFNIWLLLEVIFSGLAMYWLCREILGPSEYIPALFGGLVFVSFPTIQSHLNAGHINPLANYALPLLILAFYRIAEGRSRVRTALLGGLALWILALANFTFFAYALFPLILFGGGYYLLFARQKVFRRTTLLHLGVLLAVGFLLSLPFYIPLAVEITSPNRPAYLNDPGWVHYSSEPLNFLAFSPFTPWTKPIAPEFSRLSLSLNPVEGAAYLGVIAVTLACIGIWRRRKAAGLWLTIMLGCMIFSLGPMLKWGEQPVVYQLGSNQSNIVLPWAVFQDLPVINITRTPGRFNFLTGLALAMLAALGLTVVSQWIKLLRVRYGVVGLLVIGMLIEYQFNFPFHITPTAVVPYFTALRDRPDKRAVFDVPWDDALGQKAALDEQMVHEKPLLAGYVSRSTTVDESKLNVLSHVATGDAFLLNDRPGPLDQDAARDILLRSGADVVVYHLNTLDRGKVLDWANQMFSPPPYADQHTAIFEIPPARKTFHGIAMAYSHTGWWRQTASAMPWLIDHAALDVYVSDPVDRQWHVAVDPLLHSRRLDVKVDGHLVRSWNVSPGTLDFWLKLDPGFHKIAFVMPEDCTPVPIQPACLLYDDGPAARTEESCKLPEQDMSLCLSMAVRSIQTLPAGEMFLQPLHVRLYDARSELDLQGFRAPSAAKAGQRLTVVTDWLAVQKPAGDYHFFVHVLDAEGKLIAQADAVPGENGFPTTAWEQGQTWSQALALTLPDSVSGTYSLYTGWYRYPELQRLRVASDRPRATDGYVFLGNLVIH